MPERLEARGKRSFSLGSAIAPALLADSARQFVLMVFDPLLVRGSDAQAALLPCGLGTTVHRAQVGYVLERGVGGQME